MSEPDWWAAMAEGDHVTLWPVAGGAFGAPIETTRAALADHPGPIVLAGAEGQRRAVPTTPFEATTHLPDLTHVAAIPMLYQDHPAALSRGGETVIAGLLAAQPSFDGVLLIIGQEETIWAHISAEEVVSFQTFITPMLTRALDVDMQITPSFDQALSETLSRPERLAQHMASARVSEPQKQLAHLIGAEIAAAKPYWLGQQVIVLADAEDSDPYVQGLQAQGCDVLHGDRITALHAGFQLAWEALQA